MRARSELKGRWWLGIIVVGTACRACLRLRFAGAERVPRTGPAIVAANHVSALDGPVLALGTATRARRVVRFLVAAEFFRGRWVGRVLRLFQQIPLRRGRGDTEALDEAIATVRSGALAAIFPEGQVNPGMELQRMRTGLARIALATGAPVVPVGIWGTQRRWPRAGLTFRRPLRPRVAVVYGEPIAPFGDAEDQQDIQRFTDAVAAAVERQVAAARSLAGE